MLSIPDWFGFYTKFSSNSTATSAWTNFPNGCPDLLGSSATASDRSAVAQRITALNAQIATVCGNYANCSTDNGAVYNLWSTLNATDFTFDFFHLSIAGQAKVASAS